MSRTIAPERSAVDAANAAFAISMGIASAEEIVLRAAHFSDVHSSVRAALEARAGVVSNKYQVVEIDAEYGIHGTFLAEDANIVSDDDDSPVALLVKIKSKYKIDALAQIPVLGTLESAVEQLSWDKGVWPSLVIYIIERIEQAEENS
jgi:hypothetical protein